MQLVHKQLSKSIEATETPGDRKSLRKAILERNPRIGPNKKKSNKTRYKNFPERVNKKRRLQLREL